jgi:hypothetical protein
MYIEYVLFYIIRQYTYLHVHAVCMYSTVSTCVLNVLTFAERRTEIEGEESAISIMKFSRHSLPPLDIGGCLQFIARIRAG